MWSATSEVGSIPVYMVWTIDYLYPSARRPMSRGSPGHCVGQPPWIPEHGGNGGTGLGPDVKLQSLVVEKTQPTTLLQWGVKEAAVGSVARSCRVELELQLDIPSTSAATLLAPLIILKQRSGRWHQIQACASLSGLLVVQMSAVANDSLPSVGQCAGAMGGLRFIQHCFKKYAQPATMGA